MMGKMTLSYGVAQIAGPALTAWLAARLGGYDSGLYLAAAAMMLGIVLLLLLKAVEKRERERAQQAALLAPCTAG
jgi:dipeptide/tripeptide permease